MKTKYLLLPFLSLFCVLFLAGGVLHATDEHALSAQEAEILRLINKERAKEKLGELHDAPEINAISQEWAQKMASREKMYHRKNLLSFLKKNKWRKINENVYYSYPYLDPTLVVEGWMNSPHHRENLLMPDTTIAGVGAALSKKGTWYVAFNGADPRPPLVKRVNKPLPIYIEPGQ